MVVIFCMCYSHRPLKSGIVCDPRTSSITDLVYYRLGLTWHFQYITHKIENNRKFVSDSRYTQMKLT